MHPSLVLKAQSKYFSKTKDELIEGTAIILANFSENYTCIMQDAIQSVHWKKEQVTIHPFLAYVNDTANDKLKPIPIMKIDSSLRPFEKKSFFLDLNGFPQEASLIKNLKLLGARHEPVFSRYVSFVISNKVPLKTSPATWNQRPYSPLTPKSNGICPSPQLLSDCPMDYLDSSVYAVSPTTDQNPSSPKVQSRGMALLKKAAAIAPTTDQDPPSPKVLSRGMALLKKATQKVKENQRATDLLEHCKRWGIKVYHVDKILSKVKKYTNLIAAQYAKKKDQKKKNSKKDEYPPDVKKLLPPFIKFEDSNRKFRPVFQE
ncbi:hypothetical protein AVEN_158250-1, partial [Araneus ventricosus]